MRWETAVSWFDWLARAHFAGTLISGVFSVIVGGGAYYEGWDWLSIILAMIGAFAGIGIVYIAFCYFWDRYDDRQRKSFHSGIEQSRPRAIETSDRTAEHAELNDWRPMFQAIAHIAQCVGDLDASHCWPVARKALRQAGYDRQVTIRGRKQLVNRRATRDGDYADIHTDIDADYWSKTEINALATASQHQTDNHTDPETAYAWGLKGLEERNRYAELLVNWSDILKLWPERNSTKISLFEAATRAYEALEDKPYGVAVYGLADTPEDRLIWLCNAIFRYVDGKRPLAALYGSEPPSRVVRPLAMDVYDDYDFHIEGTIILLKSRHGTSQFENLSTDTSALDAAIRELAGREV